MSELRAQDPRRLDVRAVIEQAHALTGRCALDELPRLLEALAPADPAQPADPTDRPVAWAVQGEWRAVTGGAPQHWLRLQVDGDLSLVCQRCLGPVREHLALDRWLRFVESEAQAAELDAELDDDVLALPRWLDLVELIEDELLLALPLVPRHAVCPAPLPVPGPDEAALDEKQPHPFAALAALKRPGGG